MCVCDACACMRGMCMCVRVRPMSSAPFLGPSVCVQEKFLASSGEFQTLQNVLPGSGGPHP